MTGIKRSRRVLAITAVMVLLCAGAVYNDTVAVRLRATAGYYDEYITRYDRDHALSERFAAEIGVMALAVAEGVVSETAAVRADIFIKQGRYPADAAYSTEMEEPVRLCVAFRGRRVSEAQFVDRCVAVRDAVLARGLPVEHFKFDYRWHVSREGLGLDLEGDGLTATRAGLLAGDHVYRVYQYEPRAPGEESEKR